MYNEGCSYAVMEVSSHSLVLHRIHKLSFAAAVFTNITSDHLDFHVTFDEYLKAKKILFDNLEMSAFGVFNADDKNSFNLTRDSRARLFSYGTASNADFILKDISYDLNGTSFKVVHKGTDYPVSTALVGEFNAYNACAAFAVTVLSGFPEDKAIEGIRLTGPVPGRFEVVSGADGRKVIVDYSHTADSLEKTLLAIRSIAGRDRKICTVFGCGGNRDRTKRPVMGRIASELSDTVIITSDNPRFEDPFEIINEIKKGITKNNFRVNENREEAIKFAIESAENNSVILVAGKGHENYQEIKGVRNHFSDREVVERYLH